MERGISRYVSKADHQPRIDREREQRLARQYRDEGDTTDVMGSVPIVRHHNGPHKAMLGWSDVQNVYFDGVHTIRRLEDTGANPQVLRIPNPEPHIGPTFQSKYYWVSYRVGTLLDANLDPDHKSKLFVHEAAEVPDQSYLRDWLDT